MKTAWLALALMLLPSALGCDDPTLYVGRRPALDASAEPDEPPSDDDVVDEEVLPADPEPVIPEPTAAFDAGTRGGRPGPREPHDGGDDWRPPPPPPRTRLGTTCTSDRQCAPFRAVCNRAQGRCVQCTSNSDCPPRSFCRRDNVCAKF